MQGFRIRRLVAGVATVVVTTTAGVVVQAPVASATHQCDFDEPGNICYEVVDLTRDLVTDVLTTVRKCLRGDPGNICRTVERELRELIEFAEILIGVVITEADKAREQGEQLAMTVLMLLTDQVTMLRQIVEEATDPYVAEVEAVLAIVTARLTAMTPLRHGTGTDVHTTPLYRLAVARACTATGDEFAFTPTHQTVTVAGALLATTVAAGGSAAPVSVRLECVVLRDTALGPVTLASFQSTAAGRHVTVTGISPIAEGNEFRVCGRGEVVVSDGASYPFDDC